MAMMEPRVRGLELGSGGESVEDEAAGPSCPTRRRGGLMMSFVIAIFGGRKNRIQLSSAQCIRSRACISHIVMTLRYVEGWVEWQCERRDGFVSGECHHARKTRL